MSVAILVVSHSAELGAGVAALAGQMAPDVSIAVAAGTDDGGIGTSFDRISQGFESLRDSEGVVVVCDLGSAYLTVDTVLEFLDDEFRSRVVVSDAPLVEGAVAASVAAQAGGSLRSVVAAAATAWTRPSDAPDLPRRPDATPSGNEDSQGSRAADTSQHGHARASAELVNPSGLHARPAAEFVRTAARFEAVVRVNGVDAKSLLAIMALALPQGSSVEIEATGVDARAAVDALTDLVRSGFGEA
ncbi:dihydroxyacetone kinase phosphoryl donor subunit DhaM [Curtobacterium ammoniigenes]|uniref:dihydroxyacetone kinase phosphoryl donor subunit DhaM n=1 Tax=Curtobacterium ammoniigenes TaxID=395387 RepID=UPI00082F662B|nr:dihydroxyacetone kinase phosphoryl donor subunit DhaM [Curtobacterium ammoniigenes]